MSHHAVLDFVYHMELSSETQSNHTGSNVKSERKALYHPGFYSYQLHPKLYTDHIYGGIRSCSRYVNLLGDYLDYHRANTQRILL